MGLTSCSLCISTYNWPAALQLCLQTVLRQQVLPQQVIIADDGSGPETKDVVDAFAKKAPMPVEHVWQPDEGYQLARIRNRAFAACTGDFIIQVDGDLLLHPFFVRDHLRFASKHHFVSGSRVMLRESITEQFLKSGQFAYPHFFDRHMEKRYNSVHSPILSRINGRLQAGNYKYVLGCNMAFWKQDLLRVNGYDETFSGWGKEDNDIAIRLQHAGIGLRFLKFGAIVYHLHHKKSDGNRLEINERLLDDCIREKRTKIEKGMNQYIPIAGKINI
jgi:glycosyltransferase involved in cell wall biosynthesis